LLCLERVCLDEGIVSVRGLFVIVTQDTIKAKQFF
jgi:hypothetical protein